MKNLYKILTVGLISLMLAGTGLYAAGVIQKLATDVLQIGISSSTDDKEVIFNTGDGASNTKLVVDDATRKLKSTGNDFGFGDDANTDKRIFAETGEGNEPYLKYDSALNKWVAANDGVTEEDLISSNSEFVGQGLFNAIGNSQLESDISGYVAYADAAAATPADGTGGTPNVTVTHETGAPIRQTGSLLYTKDAANRQGEGFSFDFTLQPADLGKFIRITFEYEASANYADDDLAVFVYNIDGATLITPKFNFIKDGDNAYSVYFQADTVDDDYRLVVHQASTSALAYTVKFDDIRVSTLPKDQTIARNLFFTKFHFFDIDNSGTPTVSRDPSGIVDSTTDNGTGDFDINFESGMWSVTPFCFTISRQGGIFGVAVSSGENATTSRVQTTVHTGSLQDANVRVFCVGE